MHLLLLSTPCPRMFFGWIVGLATLVAVVFPFSSTAPSSQKIATGGVNLVIGLAVGSLITGSPGGRRGAGGARRRAADLSALPHCGGRLLLTPARPRAGRSDFVS